MAARDATSPHAGSREGRLEWAAVPDGDASSPDTLRDGLRRMQWPLVAVACLLLVGGGCTALALTMGHGQAPTASPQETNTGQTTPPVVEVTTVITTTTVTARARLPPDLGNQTCLEFEGCPDEYPLPYESGTWPATYALGGSFPDGFILGMGTAAYQVEGAYREGGRGASIWDTFTGADTVGMPGASCSYCCQQAPCPVNPAMFAKGATGNVACDHYHMVGTDVALMKSMGLRHYRFSISWPRIFPSGYSKDGPNAEGVAFYNRLINELLAAGIEPYITIYHWDLPQGLFDPPARQAWWARNSTTGEPIAEIEDEFLAFADFCFATYGDRVRTWFTFNEPWTFTFLASGWGKAPCHPNLANWSIDPYVAGHNVLVAHAKAVDIYRRKYRDRQGGKIGITLNSDWREPKTDSPEDVAAASRGMVFNLGWFADPIFGGSGDYPPAMRKFYGGRLPNFTKEESELLNGSADFFALNHYGTSWAAYDWQNAGHDSAWEQVTTDGLVHGQSVWLFGAGWGLRKLLNWVHNRYGHPPIYLTEGGWSIAAESADVGQEDTMRMLYYANYTSEMLKAMNEDGVDVRAYFAWSFLDNFEWERGYLERFGLVYNDYALGLDQQAPTDTFRQPTAGKQVRTRKQSSCWLEQVWTSMTLVDPQSEAFQGCVNSSVFEGEFTDPRHPHCIRTITVDKAGKAGHIIGASATQPDGCDGKNDKVWGPLTAILSATTIVVDFSSMGGPAYLSGFWNRTTSEIQWGDGSSWISLEAKRSVTFDIVPARQTVVT